MRRYQIFSWILAFFLMLSSIGCVSGSQNFGKMAIDDDVKLRFETFKVTPGYNYYYYGPITLPLAFMGIKEGLSLESALWRPIELTPEQLEEWIWVKQRRQPYFKSQYGSRLLTKSGEELGIYYSLEGWQQWVRIDILDSKTVRVSGPTGGNDNRFKF